MALSVRGHTSVREALKTALKKERLPSALLFRGPESVGKKIVAMELARDLLCEGGAPACGTCGSCLRMSKGQHEGCLMVRTEEISLKLEDIDVIFSFIRLKLLGRARVIIIDDAHKLNIQSANRLLKTLEEPPPHTHFILVTSQESLLPVTIRSRCQLVRFGPLSEESLQEVMDAPTWAYQACQGRLDLLSKLSREGGEDRKFAFGLFKRFLDGDRKYLFSHFSEFSKDKERTLDILVFFQQFIRDLWMASPKDLIHRDLESDYQGIQLRHPDQLENIWIELEHLKKSIEMNADRNLNLENFWFRIQDFKGTFNDTP